MVAVDGETQRPADWCVEYEWHEGTIPPPDHYEYKIQVGPGSEGKIEFCPDYPQHDPPVWVKEFPVSAQALDALYAMAAAQGPGSRQPDPGERAVGGSLAWLRVTANGKQVVIPDYARSEGMRAIHDFVRALVPEETWAGLMAQFEQCKRDYWAAEG